jgi:hypothetical protein
MLDRFYPCLSRREGIGVRASFSELECPEMYTIAGIDLREDFADRGPSRGLGMDRHASLPETV